MEEYIDSPDDIIRKIIGRNKIKYNTMTDLIDGNISDLRSFIINADAISIDLHKFFNKNKDLDKYDFVYTIASSLINIVAHYRYYFSLNGWYPNIYMLADKTDESDNISTALEITKIILKYIDNCYFIDTSNMKSGIIMKYFIDKKKDTLILSRDDFDIMHLSKRVFVIKANKEKSKFYSYDNWQKIICGDSYKEEYSDISYKLLNIILCFSGAHGRTGVKGLGFRTMMKKISHALKNNQIINDRYSNCEDFIHDMGKSLSKYKLDKGILNFKIYDIETNYNLCVNKAVEKRLDSYIEDKFSKKDLIMLNSKYFTEQNSLLLMELMSKPDKLKNNDSIKW